jgi:hypothetical protein
MNIVERRKIMCSVVCNLIAVTCVLWSLHTLIEKTRDEVKLGNFSMLNSSSSSLFKEKMKNLLYIDWAFWAKLILVAIGFTGGLVRKE